MKHLIEKTIAEQTIYEGKVIDLKIEEVELPDGNKSKREIVRHPGAVAIIAITPDNKILMVRQYRKALDRVIVEIPAGKLEKGEEPRTTAERELLEETGYQANDITFLTSFYTSPGFADELVHLYVTEAIEKGDGTVTGDDDEFIDVLEISLEEAQKMLVDQQIFDAKTAYAVQYLQLKAMKGSE